MLIIRASRYILPFLLLMGAAPLMADEHQKHDYKTLVLDILITGDSSVAGDKAENAEKIAKFSEHLRNELNDKTQFNIINDADSLAKVNAADEKQDLHHCNGCEITLAKELGAELVVMPNVFRMSHLISTLHVEFKEVASGKLIKRKSYDFRGNTDQAWERAIKYAMRDLKDWDRK
ncbi:hypothetical protein Q7A_2120 [Methylophaga nitratireducenticrescens]|uniref:Uncharacterized protein n=2 Tax=Methylophaga nitratireducenticrescens TaxID=754476 RepID=I1XKL5_METNJ|nr:hypothetical protein Q7A_2120 [Methylophaga nitratireducenticrescens]AUZ86055.1 hypothetical protein CDW43_10330 [Methylophaga nitratireducenticrescens]